MERVGRGLAAARLLHADDEDEVLSKAYYAPSERLEVPRPKVVVGAEDKPLNYKVICISMYTEDLDDLDAKVQKLKDRGMRKANRSALIRYALSRIDLDQVPRDI